MDPPSDPKELPKPEHSAGGRKVASRITWIEVLIALAIIAAIIRWLPKNWNK